MRILRSWLLLLGVLSFAACGAEEANQAQPAGTLQPAPVIEVIDEPSDAAEPYVFPTDPDLAYGSSSWCLEYESPGSEPTAVRDCSEEFEKMRVAEDAKARAIARLRVLRGASEGEAKLVAWRARNERLCTVLEHAYTAEGQAGSEVTVAFGPCDREPPCGEICLERLDVHLTEETDAGAVLGGVVSANGDELRIVLLDGKSVRYPLRGPLVSGFPVYRVFMVDLGVDVYQRLDLLVGSEVIASRDMPPEEIRFIQCSRRFPTLNLFDRQMQECLADEGQPGGR